ncbi:hypothetical protein U2A4042620020 [Corynebacterium striatum]|nr:hypothetical protein U2A4042620020 [Corynebacterium striatum]
MCGEFEVSWGTPEKKFGSWVALVTGFTLG